MAQERAKTRTPARTEPGQNVPILGTRGIGLSAPLLREIQKPGRETPCLLHDDAPQRLSAAQDAIRHLPNLANPTPTDKFYWRGAEKRLKKGLADKNA